MASSVQNIGPYGLLQSATVPHTSSAFMHLHQLCSETPCHSTGVDVSGYLRPEEKNLLVQNSYDPQKILMTKLPDGLMFHKENGEFCSILHAHSMIVPDNFKGTIPDYRVVSQVAVPGQSTPKSIKISFDNSISSPDTIDRHCVFDHVLAQLQNLGKLDNTPRQLFTTQDLGSLYGKVVSGDDALLLKEAFLGLNEHFVSKSRGESDILNRPLKLVPEISDLLMLKNPEGNITMHRCVDGLVGCRTRKSDQGNTLILVLNSEDFHRNNISPNGQVQIFKMDYAKKKANAESKRRISFVNHIDEVCGLSPEYQDQGIVHSQMRVQDILNVIEHVQRQEALRDNKCDCFSLYTQIMGAHGKE